MIGIVDYGLGNVQSFFNIYKRLDIPVSLVKNAADLSRMTHVILPGVGAFDWAMSKLENSGMRQTLDYLALEKRIPVLGICVGMQMMARCSEEGVLAGLGWFNAEVRRFDESKIQSDTHLPHMGWNDVEPTHNHDLFRGLGQDSRFYFLHSYYFDPISHDDILASSIYGEPFTCAIRRNNLYGVQFHPEKSHHYGIELLKNFSSI